MEIRAWADAPSQSPRLTFEITFNQTGNHYVWVRMFGANVSGDSLRVGIGATANAAPTQALTATTLGSWLWVRTGPINVTVGTRFATVYMQEDGTKIDAVYVTRNSGTTPPTTTTPPGGTWSYAVNPNTYAASTCNGFDFDTEPVTAGNQDEILATGAQALCYANHPAGRQVFDLSGNVKEWTAARMPGVNPMRGGASNNQADGIACGAAASADDSHFTANLGFRCCRLRATSQDPP